MIDIELWISKFGWVRQKHLNAIVEESNRLHDDVIKLGHFITEAVNKVLLKQENNK